MYVRGTDSLRVGSGVPGFLPLFLHSAATTIGRACWVALGYTTSRAPLRNETLEGRSLRALGARGERGEVGVPVVVRLSAISILLHACVRADTWILMWIIQRDILFWPSYRCFFLNSRGLSAFCLSINVSKVRYVFCAWLLAVSVQSRQGVAEHRLIVFVSCPPSAPLSSFSLLSTP